ncbi:Restriction endonuclease [Bhargavaea cecembensis DSE10]|uniref:Restriction endonuclease n=1 Tax=Bhargavaea cecembensis DSE10 TaxID=1235279 RepID=M7NFI6_9BACL|nr:restriction endonuclease [Bhargavaea cecembensis]EMR07293.1 Restriction endonuclease [Bhargavaea cecembensis DSE10]
MKKKRGRRKSTDAFTSKIQMTNLQRVFIMIFGMWVAYEIRISQYEIIQLLVFGIALVSVNVVLFFLFGLHKSFRRTRHVEYWKLREKSILALYTFLATTMVGIAFKLLWLLIPVYFICLLYVAVNKVKMAIKNMKSMLPSSLFSNKNQKIEHFSLVEIDQMSGTEFEVFLSELFDGLDHYVEITPHTDYGIDLITIKGKVKTGIQAKCYGEGKTVGVAAVNEVCGGAGQWKVQRKIVITNRYFSKKAEISAKSNQVELVDRDGLQKLIQEYHNKKARRKTPRFLRLDYRDKDKSA